METLLRNDLTAHYSLPVSTTANISITTNAQYFEIEDDENRETILHLTVGSGMAAYSNTNSHTVTIINYDKFISGLPQASLQGIKRCDLILHTSNQQHFLLNELKDRDPKDKVRTKSISQLLASLKMIMNVPSIQNFANTHTIRHCCFFNKQSMSPLNLTATTAFNRLGMLASGGLKMSNPAIEIYGFEFWEFSGNQIYNF